MDVSEFRPGRDEQPVFPARELPVLFFGQQFRECVEQDLIRFFPNIRLVLSSCLNDALDHSTTTRFRTVILEDMIGETAMREILGTLRKTRGRNIKTPIRILSLEPQKWVALLALEYKNTLLVPEALI